MFWCFVYQFIDNWSLLPTALTLNTFINLPASFKKKKKKAFEREREMTFINLPASLKKKTFSSHLARLLVFSTVYTIGIEHPESQAMQACKLCSQDIAGKFTIERIRLCWSQQHNEFQSECSDSMEESPWNSFHLRVIGRWFSLLCFPLAIKVRQPAK